MSEMTLHQSAEFFTESMKKSSSLCRELAKQTKNPQWNNIAAQLDGMRAKGEAMVVDKALSKAAMLNGLDNYQKNNLKIN